MVKTPGWVPDQNEGVKHATTLPATARSPTAQPSRRCAAGPGTLITDLRFTGDTPSWTNDGAPGSAGLS